MKHRTRSSSLRFLFGGRRSALAPLFGALALGSACSADATSTPPIKPPDVTTDRAVFEEKAMALTMERGDLTIEVPIGNPGTTAVAGTVQLALKDLSGARIDTAKQAFTAPPGGTTVTVALQGLPADTKEADLAAYLITYDVSWKDGKASGSRSAFDALEKLQVLLMTETTLEAGTSQHVSLVALDPATAKPIGNAQVQLSFEVDGKVTLIDAITDANGHAQAEVPVPADVTLGAAKLTVKVTGQGVTESEELALTIVRSRKVLLTTDKPLYQPGQTLHVRALALRKGDKAPEAKKEAILEIEDAKGNKLTREVLATDDFGIASTTFQIARQVNLGTWKVRITMGDTVSEKTISVDRYVLPKFKIDAAMDATWYRPGAEVTVSGEARYFFGKAVANGDVQITASTFDVDFTPFTSVATTTDADGHFSVKLKVPDHVVGLPLEQGKGLMKLDIAVTDGAEHTQTSSRTATIAKGAVDVALVPESGRLVAGVANTIYVVTSDPDGGPVAAKVEFDLEGVISTVQTTAQGMGQIEFVPEGTGAMKVPLTVTAGGEKVSLTKEIAIGADTETVLLRSDKAVYAAGDTAAIEVRVADATDKVWLDVVHGGRTVMLETLAVKDGKAQFAFDVDGTLAGELQIAAYYATDKGTLVRDQRLVFVQPDNELQVALTPREASYLPGDAATVDVKVTDKDGKGVAAAVGVQVVDEAVFALQETQPGLLKVFFELAKELSAPAISTGCGSCDATSVIRGDGANAPGYDDKARVTFAALGDQALHGFEKNTFTAEIDAVKAVLKPQLELEKTRVLDKVGDMASAGLVTEENLAWTLERTSVAGVDVWGYPYTAVADEAAQKVTFTSRGPDERAGTVDDMGFDIGYWEALYRNSGWGWGGAEGDFANADGGGPRPGGMEPNAPARDDGGAGGGVVNDDTKSGAEGAVKVRQDFPETLYVNPALITDGSGKAELTLDLADSITTWRMTGLASSKGGLLGSGTGGLVVFQDFFVDVDFPVAVTRNDVLRVPIAVYNYLPTAQTVTLDLAVPDSGAWYDALEGTSQTITLQPNEVKAAHFAIRATAVGRQSLTVLARGLAKSDAVRRSVDVRPDGKAVVETQSARFSVAADGGVTSETVARNITIPPENIDGAQELLVKVYPGFMSQVVEGMDSLLQLPGGCFEQTTATAWPNVLATDYLAKTGALTEAIDIKARSYITEGYQRLLTFECASGGFNWWEGDDPGNAILTAVGVMMFTDTKNVAFVDDAVIVRAAKYLANSQQSDGTWTEERHLHAGNENLGAGSLRATAYITWALLHAGRETAATDRALSYLRTKVGATEDVYTTALVTLALATKNANDALLAGLAGKLHENRIEEGQRIYWSPDEQTMVGGWDDSGKVETTAVVALALMAAQSHAADVSGALDWLLSKKDPQGNWGYSTQATVLTLKALIASLSNGSATTAASVKVLLDGQEVARRDFNDLNADVLWQVDLGSTLAEGEHEVSLAYEGTGNLMWQIAGKHYLPWSMVAPEPAGPLAIDVAYDKTELASDDIINVQVTVTNSDPNESGMMMAELGLPPGFDLDTSALDAILGQGKVARYEKTALRLVVYLEPIRPEAPVTFGYVLRATAPLEATAPESEAYLYYNREVRTGSAPVHLVVSP